MSISQREPDLQTTLQLTAVEGQGVPRGVAHVSPAALDALSCAPGDIVRIQGSRATVARIEPWPENDRPAAPRQLADGDQHIQMDGLVRQNAGVALGEVVSLTRVAAQPALSAALVPVLSPVSGSMELSDEELRQVARALKGLAAMAGSAHPAARRGRRAARQPCDL